MKLTDHLCNLATHTPYAAATESNFLHAAGTGKLPDDIDTLALWLSQDRIYAAHAYPRFIGSLIARIPFSSDNPPGSPTEKRNQRILRILNGALTNIVQEASFFDDVARKYGWDLSRYEEQPGTRNYVAEMFRVATAEPLGIGLVFLWAMEKVYLDAWSYVKRISSQSARDEGAVDEFAANWTSPEFHSFVEELAELVDEFNVDSGGADAIESRRAESVWSRVIELEKDFWPEAAI